MKPADPNMATRNLETSEPQMDRSRHIMLAHGGGGQLTDELIHQSILPRLNNDILGQLLDAAMLPPSGAERLALTIDSYVVQPWKFPGGDIGRLAVCGTVNDLSVCGARPTAIALSLILAEGLPKAHLEQVLDSIAAAAREAQVRVVTGDTKVVERTQADGIYITTAGVGATPIGRELSPRRVQPGDLLLINGPIGEHGLAVMLARQMPQIHSVLRSDVAPLNGLIQSLLESLGDQVVFLRDPTRSGLAGLVADLAQHSGWHIRLDEESLPIRPEAVHAADMLGLDPLEVANEGKVLAVVRPEAGEAALTALQQHPLGREARIIGQVETVRDGWCELHTAIGGRRIVQKPYGEQLPRIC